MLLKDKLIRVVALDMLLFVKCHPNFTQISTRHVLFLCDWVWGLGIQPRASTQKHFKLCK